MNSNSIYILFPFVLMFFYFLGFLYGKSKNKIKNNHLDLTIASPGNGSSLYAEYMIMKNKLDNKPCTNTETLLIIQRAVSLGFEFHDTQEMQDVRFAAEEFLDTEKEKLFKL